MKIELELQRENRPVSILQQERERGMYSMPIKASLPFFRSFQGILIHRIRSGKVHYQDFKPSHTSFRFWCGNDGFAARGAMMDSLPSRAVLCATCEGRAIGAGLCGTREINGRKVLYRPRI